MAAKLKGRQERFGTISKVLQKEEKKELQAEEQAKKKKRGERFGLENKEDKSKGDLVVTGKKAKIMANAVLLDPEEEEK